MIEKIAFVLIILTCYGGMVWAQTYKDFATFELCTRTPGHGRDHELIHIRKSSIRAVQATGDRPDCSIIASAQGRTARVYGTVQDVIRRLESPDMLELK